MSKQKTDYNTILKNIFPFLVWIRELRNFKVLKSDIIAWITLSFIVIPQSMAYAELAWLPIEVGLYTSFISIMVAGLFWSSKQMSTWSITIVSLMTATAIASIWVTSISVEAYIVYASLLAFFIGVFYLILSFLRLGVIVDFLSHPVIIGFTNAAAIITLTSQAWKIFWVSYEKWDNYFEWIYNLIISSIEYVQYPTLAFWLWWIILLVFLWKIFPKIPRVLVVIIISTFLSYKLWFDWKIIEIIPNSLPSINIPFLSSYLLNDLSTDQILNLMVFALIIWLIWFTQSISVAKYVWTKTKQRVSANKELYWQWIANISSSLFWWYWVAWSLSKTAVNLRAWAKTWFSSVITWLMVWVTILFFTPYLYYLPMATLAAIIIVAVSDLIKIKTTIKVWKTEIHDWIVAVVTFSLTLLLSPNIEMWIFIWVTLSLALFIYRSMRPRLIEVAMYKDWQYRDKVSFALKTSKHVSIFRFDWVLFFANAWYFESTILDFISKKEKLKYVIFDLEWMSDIDSSWLEVLEHLYERLDKENWVKVYFSSLRVKVIQKFIDSGFLKYFWKKNIFVKVKSILKYIEEKEWDNVDLESLWEYCPGNKNNEEFNEEGKDILEKYVYKK